MVCDTDKVELPPREEPAVKPLPARVPRTGDGGQVQLPPPCKRDGDERPRVPHMDDPDTVNHGR